jgi:thymidylate synthase
MPRKSSQPPTPVGEVVLMNKPAPKPKPAPPPPPPEPIIKEISATKYEKEVRPKKELSEKQKANLEKLIERNKAKAIERRAVVKEVIPESIPEDKILVKILPKRVYNRKPKNEIIMPTPDITPAPSEFEQTESEYTESESEPEVKPRKRRERKQAPKKRIVPKYSYDTETTTADEDSSESEDDYKVAKYQVKAEKRIKALEKIDKRLNQLQHNPYQSREMSVF